MGFFIKYDPKKVSTKRKIIYTILLLPFCYGLIGFFFIDFVWRGSSMHKSFRLTKSKNRLRD